MSPLALQLTVAQSCPPTLTDAGAFALQEYDFVIIGTGPGGMTLATRLSENPSLSVAILEAGPLRVPDDNVDIPGLDARVIFTPEYDWMRGTVPTEFTAGRSIPAPRGKLVGGSSATNGMAWSRATKEEHNTFDLLNNGSGDWTWDTFLPYWRKVENIKVVLLFQFSRTRRLNFFSKLQNENATVPIPNLLSNDIVGNGGPMNISLNKVYPDSIPPYLQSIQAMNPPVPVNTKPMSGDTLGIWNTLIAVDLDTGKRNYPATSYYCTVAGRPNLHVITGAQATRVIFEKDLSPLKATGVEFSSQNSSFIVNATREVILSAGVINTPQLLELSGIGNAKLLRSLDIEVLLDMPGVGENLQEHFYIGSTWEILPNITTFDALKNPDILSQQREIFDTTGGGLLSATSSIIAYLSHRMLFDDETVQKLRDLFEDSLSKIDPATLTPLAIAQHQIQRDWLARGTIPEFEIIQINLGLVNADKSGNKSYISTNCGVQHINTTDPLASPAINGNYLSTDYDIQVLVEILKWNRRLATISPFADIIVQQTGPTPDVTSDEDLKQYIRENFSVGSHIVGTASMVPPELGGVVDTKLKVYGTTNLRVMDISVWPMELAAHPQATVFAMSERLADIIKGELY
ncbi:hypothetical protein D9758_011281 [Tetrapyrgos nigripes]|uniref:Alcohol oxidase n=1 Tax=Tetrapyrgos nigripes TaxID=182062 RepID=A0A8H5FSQ9_9AGAR|nr:hypothetical protein D9758_011281 [Tetrapyrgos nigripes]